MNIGNATTFTLIDWLIGWMIVLRWITIFQPYNGGLSLDGLNQKLQMNVNFMQWKLKFENK